MNAEQREAVVQRVADAARQLLTSGYGGLDIAVPELDETWTLSRDSS